MSTEKLEKKLKATIRQLLEEPPKTKAGTVVSLWPEISEALAKGHKIGVIWNRMQAGGLEMKYNQFRTYVSRMRKKHVLPQGKKMREAPRSDEGKIEMVQATLPAGHGRQASPSSTREESEARTREYLRKGQGIQWKGTKDEDPHDLF